MERRAKRRGKLSDDEEQPNPNGGQAAAAAGFLGIFSSLPALLEKGMQMYQLFTVNQYNAKLAPGQLPINPMTGRPDGQAVPLETVAPMPPNASTPQEPAGEEQTALQEIFSKLETVAPFVLNHLRNNKTGTQFAKFIIDATSKQEFEQLRSIQISVRMDDGTVQPLQGRDALWFLIREYPPIWEADITAGVKVKNIAPKVQQFIQEVCAYGVQ
jgi:hypothetical protein